MRRLLKHRAVALTLGFVLAVGSFYGCRTIMGADEAVEMQGTFRRGSLNAQPWIEGRSSP